MGPIFYEYNDGNYVNLDKICSIAKIDGGYEYTLNNGVIINVTEENHNLWIADFVYDPYHSV